MERIKLNLIPSGVAPIVHLSQYDDGRKFGIDLFEGESVYVLDGTETLTVNSRKPDGHVVVITVTNTGTSSLDVDTVEQLTAVHGVSYAKLKIEKGSVTIATLPFLIDVSRDPLENGDPSESFVDNLQTQIALAVADQYDSANVVFDNTPTAGHGVGFAVTSEGVKTALDNLPIPDELNDLSDVNISGQAQGEALVWDGTKWVNGTVSTVGNLDDLNDVDTTGKATGDSLRYDGNSWVAKPTTIALTQAEYDALQTKEPNTHYVITDAPNLNATASDIEYSSGVTVKQAIDSKANTSDLATVATSGSYSDLINIPNNIFRCAYSNTASVTVYEIDYDYMAGISRRPYGMAIVSAWKDIFALHYNSDNTIFIVPLTPNPQRTVTCEWVSSTRKIKLTFSGQVWSGIAVYPM